ncbi:MAG TPA: phosphoenolpyruvate--protein phosphotransferase [Candidatus Krumholzibacteria bacterium]|nr:phosphoenolpyruvate--protein phosphotransferase [Candidatus Krumholzibacteria bacterium]
MAGAGKEMRLRGLAVAPGIAVGRAYVQRPREIVAPNFIVAPERVEAELARFHAALARTSEEIRENRMRLAEKIGEDHAKIFDAHLLILQDTKAIEDTEALVRKDLMCAEFAFNRVIGRILESFDAIGDVYLRERRADVEDVRRRVLHNLIGLETASFGSLNEEAIVVARDLVPSDTAMIDRRFVLGVATDRGGRTAHAAILARSFGIPAVVGVEGLSDHIEHGDGIILDGNTGQVVLRPTPESLREFAAARTKFEELERELLTLKDYPAVTRDGRKIELSANVKTPADSEVALAKGAKGVGLYRTEWFFLTRDALPSEEEQVVQYTQIVRAIAPDPVIFRALDIGGDKFASYLGPGKSELNPFLGWRGIRFLLTRHDILRTQLRAFLRASVAGKVKIMFPMITGLEEVRAASTLVDEVKAELQQEGRAFDEGVEVGLMIETPSAVAIADLLAKETDFFSIGSNDLVQYTLAVDRSNARISYLYEPMHPSVLRLVRNTVDAGHAEGIWVGMCGEIAGDPLYSVLLVGLGLDELSISAYMIPEVKRIIRGITYDEAKTLAHKALGLSTAAEIRHLVSSVMHERFPELVAAESNEDAP